MDEASNGRRLPAGEYWFGDLNQEDHYETSGVTVTEAHVVGFAGLAGDFFDVHMDDVFARAQGFPARIAHGLLGLSMVDGLKTRCAVRLMAVATLGWNWNFRAPILIGDRIHAVIRIKAKRLTSRGDRGVVTLGIQVLNDKGAIVQEGETPLMVQCRPALHEAV